MLRFIILKFNNELDTHIHVAHVRIQYEIFFCGEDGTSDPNLEAR